MASTEKRLRRKPCGDAGLRSPARSETGEGALNAGPSDIPHTTKPTFLQPRRSCIFALPKIVNIGPASQIDLNQMQIGINRPRHQKRRERTAAGSYWESGCAPEDDVFIQSWRDAPTGPSSLARGPRPRTVPTVPHAKKVHICEIFATQRSGTDSQIATNSAEQPFGFATCDADLLTNVTAQPRRLLARLQDAPSHILSLLRNPLKPKEALYLLQNQGGLGVVRL